MKGNLILLELEVSAIRKKSSSPRSESRIFFPSDYWQDFSLFPRFYSKAKNKTISKDFIYIIFFSAQKNHENNEETEKVILARKFKVLTNKKTQEIKKIGIFHVKLYAYSFGAKIQSFI